ncbi:signal peptidase i [hydrocarbon metagenome]|uniref:signal peptidase I n=1 Tax=hydrocarbon metagenome TaxID=938273 RepID=A0A0W8E5W1_9ZZZZ
MVNDWILLIVLTGLIAVIINRFLFYVTVVSSFSMYPALKPGDRLLTVRIYSAHRIKRGDILVFYNLKFHEMMIKRVIGLPGDEVELTDGIVHINHNRYVESYVECPARYTGRFNVPEKHYLFLGDNRTDSIDSRNWAQPYIPEKNIRGKVTLRLFPIHRLGKFDELGLNKTPPTKTR